MYVPRATYSLRISFWMVPRSRVRSAPCFLATAIYIANRMAAGALMVMEVLISFRGIPAKRVSMSSSESMATPTLPTSPSARG